MNYLMLILTVFVLFSCGSNPEKSDKQTTSVSTNQLTLTAAQLQSANLQVGILQRREVSSILKLNGKMDVPPQNLVSISMPLGGYLASTKLLPGMRVRRGEVIAVMEDQQYIQLQQEYLTTKAQLKFAETELNRQKELNKTQSASDKIYQLAQMEYTTYKVTLKSLAEKLKLINVSVSQLNDENITKSVKIVSPIDGYVSSVKCNVGKYVTPADVLFELIDPSDIHLNLTVYEKDLSKLEIGQRLHAYTNTNPELKYPCEIILISQDISNQRSAEVHCHFKNYDKKLFPGMYMNAEVEIKSHQVLTIPEQAIVAFEGKNYVFTKESEFNFKMEEVKLGVTEAGYSEIVNAPFFEGKQVVTAGSYTLLMALKNKSEE